MECMEYASCCSTFCFKSVRARGNLFMISAVHGLNRQNKMIKWLENIVLKANYLKVSPVPRFAQADIGKNSLIQPIGSFPKKEYMEVFVIQIFQNKLSHFCNLFSSPMACLIVENKIFRNHTSYRMQSFRKKFAFMGIMSNL